MGNTWSVDLRHYLTLAGAMASMPSRARLLAEYFAGIVVDATTNLDEPPPRRCRLVADDRGIAAAPESSSPSRARTRTTPSSGIARSVTITA
jgi:hypothetical protein